VDEKTGFEGGIGGVIKCGKVSFGGVEKSSNFAVMKKASR
jgi:hypothetical protein